MTKRQFEEFTDDNDNVVSYHVVTEETAGDVVVIGGNSQRAMPGNVLVKSDRPDVYVIVNNTDALGIPEAAPEPAGIGFVEDDDEETVE